MTYRFGIFEVDVESGELRKQGRRIHLQEQPLAVLELLLRRPGEVVTREELAARLWPEGAFVERDEGLNTAVKRLRDALGDSASSPRFVETIPRRGYRFVAPVETVDPHPPAPSPGPPEHARPGRGGDLRWKRPVAILLLLALAALSLGLALARRSHGLPEDRIRLAVLPLEGDPALADGLTEELIAQLGRLLPERLGVIARTSVQRFRGEADLREVGNGLRVQYVLEGSVRREADRVRISTRLIQVSDETQLWSETWDRGMADLFEVQREVARGVARGLSLQLLPEQEAALARATTDSTGAYQAFLAGRHLLHQGTARGFEEALASFRRAVEIDPEYAVAWAAIAETLLTQADFYLEPAEEVLPRAREAARTAAALDPDLPEVLVLSAELRRKGEQTEEGVERSYRRAIELNPSYAYARQRYALFLMERHRFPEAGREIARALELDPLSPEAHMNAGWIRLDAGDPEGAVLHLRKALEVEPGYPAAWFFLCWAYRAQGKMPEALEAAARSLETSGGAPKYVFLLGSTYAAAGRKDEARAQLVRLRALAAERWVAPGYLENLEREIERPRPPGSETHLHARP